MIIGLMKSHQFQAYVILCSTTSNTQYKHKFLRSNLQCTKMTDMTFHYKLDPSRNICVTVGQTGSDGVGPSGNSVFHVGVEGFEVSK